MQELKFHHVGIPTSEKLPEEDYNKKLKMHATGYLTRLMPLSGCISMKTIIYRR